MMEASWKWSFLAVLVLTYSVVFNQVSALDADYCSSDFTGSTPRNSSIYQSNGLCHDFCIQDYAFAITQEFGCWCSNYAPSSTTTGCNQKCPGYGFEICGGKGLFSYIVLKRAPSGTGGSTAVSTRISSVIITKTIVTATPDVTTIFATVTDSPYPRSPSAASPPSTLSSEPRRPQTTPATSSSSSATWTPTPVISLETVTGQVRTVTVTPTVPPNSANMGTVSKESSGGLTTGAAVGLTIGLVSLLSIVFFMAYFCFRKRRSERGSAFGSGSRRDSTVGLGGPVPSRTMSENSRYILGTDGKQVVETWEAEGRDAPGNRRSRLMPVDPRLDPFAAVYQRGDNKSRESVNTIRDDHDYSRRVHQQGPILRATNPDA